MPLWLIRVIGAVAAALVLAQVASLAVGSGALLRVVMLLNPVDHHRQLERSIVHAYQTERADMIVMGGTPFIEAVREGCAFQSRAAVVPIDGARLGDYAAATSRLIPLQPTSIVFQARPHLWTNMRGAGSAQSINLLPRSQIFRGLFPIDDVRIIIGFLKELAQPQKARTPQSFSLATFKGALFDSDRNQVALRRITQLLSRAVRQPTAIFVLDPEEIPDDALPETREKILELFSKQSDKAQLRFVTSDVFASEFGCKREPLLKVAEAMRQPPTDAGEAPEIAEEN